MASRGSGAHERRRLSAARSARGAVGPGPASACGSSEASVWSPPHSSSFSSPPHCTLPRGDRPVRDLSRSGLGLIRGVSSHSSYSRSAMSSSCRAAATYTCVGRGRCGVRLGWGGGRAELSLSLSLGLELSISRLRDEGAAALPNGVLVDGAACLALVLLLVGEHAETAHVPARPSCDGLRVRRVDGARPVEW